MLGLGLIVAVRTMRTIDVFGLVSMAAVSCALWFQTSAHVHATLEMAKVSLVTIA